MSTPRNMNDVCRLCMSESDRNLSIFGEEGSGRPGVPLSFRILACVSLEVSETDGLSSLICENCLNVVNVWHDFKRRCDFVQATLKEWKNPPCSSAEKDDNVNPEEYVEMAEVSDVEMAEASGSAMTFEVKQEAGVEQDEPVIVGNFLDGSVIGVMENDPLSLSTENLFRRPVSLSTENLFRRPVSLSTENLFRRPVSLSTENLFRRPVSLSMENLFRRPVSLSMENLFRRPVSLSIDNLLGRPVSLSMENLFRPVKTEREASDEMYFSYDEDAMVSALPNVTQSDNSAQSMDMIEDSGAQSLDMKEESGAQSFDTKEEIPIIIRKKKPRKRLTHPRKKPRSRVENNENPKETGNNENPKENESHENPKENENHVNPKENENRENPKENEKRENTTYSVASRSVRSFTCKVCNESFIYNYLLKNHSEIHSRESNVCSICKKIFSSKATLERHFQLHGAQKYTCQNCLLDFPGESLYLAHVHGGVCHENQEDNSPNVEIFDCYICKNSFPSRLKLKMHMSVHPQFKCPRCKKTFSGGIALSNHLRSHSARGFKRHSCKVCLKSFSSIAALASHKKYHYFPKRYTISKKTIAKKNGKEVANNTVSSETAPNGKGLICGTCRKWFKNQSALERHMTTHTKLKLYSCTICKTSMGYASSVHKHMKKIHGMVVNFKSIKSENFKNTNQVSKELNFPSCSSSSSSEQTEHKKLNAKTFNCKFCHKVYPTKHMYEIHQKIVHMEKRTYKCTICNKVFAFRSYLARHVKVHASQTLYTCTVCSKVFASQKTLNNHKGVHTRFRYYTCTICNKSFNGIKTYDNHQKMHKQGVCPKKFISKSELHQHKKNYIFKMKIYSCNICENSYNSSSALSKHKRKHYVQSPFQKIQSRVNVNTRGSCICNICKKSFSCLSALRRHKRLHLKTSNGTSKTKIVNGRDEKICIICSRQFPDHASLVRHKGWHTRRPESLTTAKQESVMNSSCANLGSGTTLTHDCHLCSKSFTHRGSLRKHVKLNHPSRHEHLNKRPIYNLLQPYRSKPVKGGKQCYTCMICTKQFHSRKALITHRGWHSRLANSKKMIARKTSTVTANVQVKEETKNFYCSLCNKNFITISAYNVHKHFHTRNLVASVRNSTLSEESKGRPFSCDMCSKSFKCEDYLIIHQRMHTGERPFACDMCPQAYHRRANLWKHKKTHLASYKPFSCTICDEEFSLKEEFTQHMAIHAQNVFPCATCGMAFSRLDYLKQHAKCHA